MRTKPNHFARASALQITFSIALIFVSAILLATARVASPILGDYPDTTLALSTDTTVTPDAPPTNTTSINVSTSTDFKGTLAGDPTTGVVRVTDAHPAGTYTVTVTAFDSGGGTATKTFALTVTTPVTCLPVGFAAANNYDANGDYTVSVAVGDFNGDGKQDLVVAHEDLRGTVSVLLGDGAGDFSAATNFSVDDDPVSVTVGDFNGDGKQDLAAANLSSSDVSILLGDGTGNFSSPTNFTTGDYTIPTSVAVGDFNGDGKQDLAVAKQSNSVSILLGDGTGNFSAPTNFAVGASFPHSVAVGDFNGDGKQDIATANYYSENVSILLGDGTGNFSAPTNFAVGASFPVSVAVGDFNGDGKQDIATANSGGDSVSILLGDGQGNFSAPANFAVGDHPYDVVVGDFNGDGKEDLATASYISSGTVSILLGDGTGNFSAPTNFTVGDAPISLAAGDFNGDGKQDLATANYFGDNVSILLRDCPVSQITPADTSCTQFSSGTAQTIAIMQYDLNSDLIHRVGPRNLLYWAPVTVPVGNNIFTITQTITTGNFNTFFAAIGNGSNVFDSDCVPLQRSIRQSGNTVTARFAAPVAGTYYISIRFNAQNLSGQPAPNPGTIVHYDFTTTGVPDSTSGLDLVHY
jgi:FG-GAP-like repeat/FG-GAP repeat/Bacterial pre-peptidase C-terminal domain